MGFFNKWTPRSTLFVILTGSLLIEISFYTVRWIFSRMTPSETKRKSYNKVLFFPDKKPTCKASYSSISGCVNKKCQYGHTDTNFGILMQHLRKTRKALDICLFVITSTDLGEFIIKLHEQGICIRVITDDEQIQSQGSQIVKFMAAGIQVRHDNSPNLMHHKFVIIDDGLLINGSFNWTRAAVLGNNENVLITNSLDVIKAYREEYEKLWAMFEPKLNMIG